MASGRTAPAKIRLATTHEVRPEMELQLDAPAKAGARVRVHVLDEDLFRTGALAKDYDRVFSVFIGASDPVLPGVVRDAANLVADGSNGVLLVFECAVVGNTPKGARKHQKWAFGAAESVKTCNPSDVLVDIALGMRDEHNEIAFGPTIRLPVARAFNLRRVVVVVSDSATHEILYSNTWRTPRFLKLNMQAAPTLVDSKAVEAAIPARVGGDGEGTGAPAPAGRVLLSTDITGMWEAFRAEGEQLGFDLPTLMVQINVAGGAIAGWWAPPPERITGHAHQRLTQPAPPAPLERGQFGVLLGHFESDGFHIQWGPTDVSEDPTPERVGAIKSAPNAKTGIGLLALEQEERLRLTLQRGATVATLHLRKAEPTPRWSNATIDQVLKRAAESSPFIRRSIRGHQQQPIPLAFWGRMLQPDLGPNGKLGQLIIAHESTPTNDSITRRALLTQISNYLEGLTQEAEHSEAVVAHFTLFASNVELTIGGLTHSTYDWLHKLAADFMSNQAEQGASAEETLSRLPNGFKEVGIVPRNLFVYKTRFFSLGAQIPLGIKVGAYAFDAEIERKVLTNEIEGEPKPPDRWFRTKKKMFGGFGDVGVSLGAGLKTGASKLLSSVSFRSFHNVEPEQFNEATFYVVSASALSASAALLSATGASSAVMVMTVNTLDPSSGAVTRSVRMVAGVDSFMVGPDPSKPKTQLIRKNPQGFSFSIFSLTLGVGWMTEKEAASVRPPTEATPPEETLGEANRSFVAFFRKNSATLEGRNLSALEEELAVERAIFVSGGGHASAAGHASPEGPNNQQLSQRRADNVIQVLQNSFGKQLAVATSSLGYGHRAALNAGMIRPEAIEAGPAGNAKRELYRKQEATQFPQFRVVMLWVNGILLIEIKIGKALMGT